MSKLNELPEITAPADADNVAGYRPAGDPASRFSLATLFAYVLGKITWLTSGGRTSAAQARSDIGLGNVDNTADTAKPVSTAQQAALDLKAALASPTFTGTPAAPTAAVDTNTTQLATTAFVLAQASAVGDGTPAMDGTAARGTSTHFARADHVHPTDTTLAPKASPTFTGTPAAPTAASGDNSTQIATTAFASALAAAMANTKASRGGVNFQGSYATSSLGSNVAGTDDFALSWVMDVPTANPATAMAIISLANTVAGDGSSGVQFISSIPNGTQTLRVTVMKAGNASRRDWDATTSLITNYGGKRITCAVTRSGTTVKLYINGGLINSETHADWATDLTGAPYFLVGTNWGSTYYGSIYAASFYNLALSAAEVQELHELGGVPAERFKFGSYTNTIDTAFANGSYDTFSGGSTTGFTAVHSGSGTKLAGSNGNYTSPVYPIQIGTRWRVKFTETLNSGQAPNIYLQVGGGATYAGPNATANGANVIDMVSTAVPSYQGMFIGFSNSANANYSISSFSIIKLGAVVHLNMDDGIGFQLHDASTNKLDAVVTTASLAQGLFGFNHIVKERRGYVRGTLTWAGTHEGKSLLGQRALPNNAVVTLIARQPTASSSGSGCTIGTTNSATRWQALAAITANTKAVATVANQLPAGTANGDTDILVDPDTANYTGSITTELHYSITEP